MSTSPLLRRARSMRRESACPECGNPITTDTPFDPGKHFVCGRCGAISISGSDSQLRLLRTEEWLGIIQAPDFLELLERRELLMERIVEAHGGELNLGETSGPGAEFRLILPVSGP